MSLHREIPPCYNILHKVTKMHIKSLDPSRVEALPCIKQAYKTTKQGDFPSSEISIPTTSHKSPALLT